MKINDDLVNQLSHLCRLEFSETEKPAIKNDLEKVISFCEKLNELDTENVEPLIYLTDEVNNLREDEEKHDITQHDALRNAPNHDSDYFKVPKVIDK